MCDQSSLGQLIAAKSTCNRKPSLFPRQILRQREVDDHSRGLVERCGHVQARFWRHITVVIRDELLALALPRGGRLLMDGSDMVGWLRKL
jgi:hypothetical protein